MDDVELKALAYVLKKELKKYYHERNVYRLALAHLKSLGVQNVDAIVDDILQDQALEKATDHDLAFVEKWLPPIPEVELQMVQQKWLENWKPTQEKPH